MLAFCAHVLIQSNPALPPAASMHGEYGQISSPSLGQILLEECVRVRKAFNFVESPNVTTVTTSFWLHSCHFCLDQQNTAWFYLREATTFALTMGMHDEETYKTGDIIECSRRRRLYWLLFVTER